MFIFILKGWMEFCMYDCRKFTRKFLHLSSSFLLIYIFHTGEYYATYAITRDNNILTNENTKDARLYVFETTFRKVAPRLRERKHISNRQLYTTKYISTTGFLVESENSIGGGLSSCSYKLYSSCYITRSTRHSISGELIK